MRPSRMLVLGLAGLVALHVFMLAGHGRSHDVPMVSQMGESAMAVHAGPSVAPSTLPAPPLPAGHHGAEMAMTVACLAVLAGLSLLLPGRQGWLATERPQRPTAIGQPLGPGWQAPEPRPWRSCASPWREPTPQPTSQSALRC